jgi:hypothetical protein
MNAVSNPEDALLRSVMVAAATKDPQRSLPEDDRTEITWNLPGFTGDVRVGTVFGDLPIKALRLRDEIRTALGTIARVQWIDKVHLDEEFLHKHPSAHPVRILANTFAAGKPMQEMLISPRQEICLDAHVATKFVQAVDLCRQSRAFRVRTAGLTYYRFHCGDPVSVRVEGVWVRVGR